MEPVDPLAILAVLGISDAHAVTPISEGWGDTRLWRVERSAGLAVLRLFPAAAEREAEREVVAQEAALAGGVPVPRLEASGSAFGHAALLLSWLPGRSLLAALEAQPDLAWLLGIRAGRMQARIHAVPATARLRELGGDWIDWGAAQDRALSERLASLDSRSVLLHLDYHPLNVLIDERQVSGVIDWANATAGDPRADVARTLTILELLPSPVPLSPEARRSRRGFIAGYLHGYQRRGQMLGELDLFLVWAGGVMLRDLTPKLGQPGVWLADHHLSAVRRTVNDWRERLGLPALSA